MSLKTVFMGENVSRCEQANHLRQGEINLAGVEVADVHVKKAGETPGHSIEEQQVHNERWAGALRLMGRFIISHYQLIPSDRPGPAGADQEYVKEGETEGGWEPAR